MERTKKIAVSAIILAAIALVIVNCKSEESIYMNKVYEELKTEILPNEAEVQIIEDSVKVIFKNGVLFGVSDSIIMEEMHPSFNRFAGVLNKYPNTSIIVTGHTDNTGEEEYNKILSKYRAENAQQLLIDFDVRKARLSTLGHGSMEPVATNDTHEGRARNRRIEFIILYNIK